MNDRYLFKGKSLEDAIIARFGQRLKATLKGLAIILSVVFVLALLFVILPFTEIDLDNGSILQAWATAFVDTTLEFLVRSALTVFFTVTALGLMLDIGWIKIGKRKRDKCGDCPYKLIARNFIVETEAKHDENKN